MVNETTLNVTMDADLKERAEELYRRLVSSALVNKNWTRNSKN